MKKYILASLFAITFSMVFGQTEAAESQLDTNRTDNKIEVDEVQVIKQFEANLAEAKKLSLNPEIPVTKVQKKEYVYDITIKPVEINYADPVIRPLAMKPDPEPEVDNFYAKVGYGNLASPFAQVSYQGVVRDLLDFQIYGDHHSFDDTERVENRKLSVTNTGLKSSYRVTENHKVSLDFKLGLFNTPTYDTTSFDFREIDFERKTTLYDAELGFSNIERTEGGFNYDIRLGGELINIDQMNPGQFDLGGREQALVGSFAVDKAFGEKLRVGITAAGEMAQLSKTSVESSRKTFQINPHAIYQAGIFNIEAGVDVILDDTETKLFPKAEVGVGLFDNSLEVFAGANQTFSANSLRARFLDNFYVNPGLNTKTNSISQQIYGGLRGNLKDFVSFNIAAGNENITNQIFYDLNNNLPIYNVVLDDMSNFFINGNLNFKITDQINVGAIVTQNFYNPEFLQEVINMPPHNYNAYGNVALLDNKLILKGEVYLAGKINFIDFNEQLQEGNSLMDLNAEVNYFVTKNIGIWARANNILNREYLRFEGYPTVGFNAHAGALLKF